MRLEIEQESSLHKDVATGVGWTSDSELISCADDGIVQKWSLEGEPLGEITKIADSFPTVLHLLPKKGQGNVGKANEIFAVGCSDGTIRLYSMMGRLEKKVEAHKGAVLSLKWNHDGTAMVSTGEDGVVRVWSRTGMLRSTLLQAGKSVYASVWAPDGDSVLFTSGQNIVIKPLQPTSKPVEFKAHDGLVLCVDWSIATGLILTGGEDGRFKIHDNFGRCVFQSTVMEEAISACAWAADGELFAVSAFNTLWLCDQSGWIQSRTAHTNGSATTLEWSPDGTELAVAMHNGAVCFAHILERSVEWGHQEAILADISTIVVKDHLGESSEELDFRDRIVKLSLAYGHLVVCTSLQCYIYSHGNWTTPSIFDLRHPVSFLVQCESCFATVDPAQGVVVWSYEGRQVANPRKEGIRPEFLTGRGVVLAEDVLAVLDHSQPRVIHFFDTATGKPLKETLKHTNDIQSISLSHDGNKSIRKLTIIDKSNELYVALASQPSFIHRLAVMVTGCVWASDSGMLAAYADGALQVWLHPQAAFVDPDLCVQTRHTVSNTQFGPLPRLIAFSGSQVTLRKNDGSLMHTTISTDAFLLYRYTRQSDWDQATRLCRMAKEPLLWATLASIALDAKELNTAEIALAAVEEVDKLAFIVSVKEIPHMEGRNAALALYKHRPKEAEQILVQAGLVFRAIKMHVNMFNWERALELAVRHRTQVEMVLGFRQKYLDQFGQKETSKRFLHYAKENGPVDWERVNTLIAAEKEKERLRGTGLMPSAAAPNAPHPQPGARTDDQPGDIPRSTSAARTTTPEDGSRQGENLDQLQAMLSGSAQSLGHGQGEGEYEGGADLEEHLGVGGDVDLGELDDDSALLEE
eukprot:GCRY01003755.1.p1 GENE.GCRY01003755.1~~GCRY01003755.1.p1  ORF type:complete len:862 (+),score=264.97 GCRY01003755.1:209-2794(+)